MNTDKFPLYIFDLDGTLSNADHRQHYLKGGTQDWDAFFEACDRDTPNKPVIKILKQLNFFSDIRIFSGRSEAVREKTIEWLVKHTGLNRIELPRIKMRAKGDYTPDEILKLNWYKESLSSEERERVVCIFDDRNKVVSMWRSLGVTCLQVNYGDF